MTCMYTVRTSYLIFLNMRSKSFFISLNILVFFSKSFERLVYMADENSLNVASVWFESRNLS